MSIFTFLLFATNGVSAVSETSGEEAPRTLSATDFKELLESSPFTRTLNISDTLALTGVAHIGGKPVLTLFNRTTNESFLVSEEPNAQGWRIMEIYPSEELGKVEAKVSAGPGQVVSVRFDERQLKPDENKKPPNQNQPPRRDDNGGRRDDGGGERRGPSPEMMKRYNALSPEQQQRFREIMREQFTKNRDMNPDERQKMVERTFNSLEK